MYVNSLFYVYENNWYVVIQQCVCQARYTKVSTLSTICIVVSGLNKAMSENMEDPS